MAAIVSFKNDIAPTLFRFRGPMAWRFDLANPVHVKANYDAIWAQISTDPPGMPPPPFEPFPKEFVEKFAAWKSGGWAP